ncbi:efflux RND transporter permease subunit [Myxococcota bacterium]|nr:efflux RND transporter permease subunit [Myxococcota bacterium]
MNPRTFVEHPVLALVLSIVILIFGLVAYPRLPVRETPDVQQPIVTVQTTWPGADPALVEGQVTETLEREINGIEGVRTLTSQSVDQQSSITVEFDLGRDLEAAANDVRSRVSRARRRLPPDVLDPVVEKSEASAQPVIFLRVVGEGRDLLSLTEIADTVVRERLQNAVGVGAVEIMGEQRFAMRVELDPAALSARGLSPLDVEAALQAQNVQLPAGRVEGQAMDINLRLDAAMRTPEEFEALVLSDAGGGVVRLGDVAEVRLGSANERQAARADGVPSLSLSIAPLASANIIELSDDVRARLPEVQAALPTGVSVEVQYDRSQPVRRSIHDVQLTLIVAFTLVAVVIFAFLRDLRSTAVPLLAIPVSIVGTFFAIWLFGFSVNVFTLFGLVLAIGLVVDDAIVVLENVHRRIQLGESPHDAAIAGTDQVRFAVIATTISLIVVFLPVIFTGGTTGRLFVEFGTTVAVAVALSALVALTLTPMLCAFILKPEHSEGAQASVGERLFERVEAAFGRTLDLAMRRKVLALPVLAVAAALGFAAFRALPQEFFPIEDRNVFFVRTVAPEGTAFPYLDTRMKALEPMLMETVPERMVMLTRVASAPGSSVSAGNIGTFVFPLKPADERERSQQEIVDAVRKALSAQTGFLAIPIQFPTVGRSFNPPLQIVLMHPDFEALKQALPGVVGALRQVPGLVAVNEDLKINRPELQVAVDRERAAAAGITTRQLARGLQIASSGLDVSDFPRGSRQYDVLLGLPPSGRDTPDEVADLRLRAADGGMVPLDQLVRFEERSTTNARYRYMRSPSATVSASLDGITLGQGLERALPVVRAQLGEGFSVALAGESRDFADAQSSGLGIFGLALVLVFLTLAAQFDSFRDPLAVLLTVPFALVGAVLGLWVLGMTFSFFAQVGLILLIGLVTKNGILIVEYARQLVHQGKGLSEAAVEATRLRFRPILMTSIATVGGALPIAIGWSGGSRTPLGVVVVAGMLLSTALTLYIVPMAWIWFHGRQKAGPGPGAAAGLALAATLAGGLLAGGPARAGELSLEQALRLADQQMPALVAARAGVEADRATVGQARAGALPQVAGSASLLVGLDPRSSLGGDGQVGTVATAGARVDLPLLDLATWGQVGAAQAGLDASEAAYRASRQELLAQVAGRWLALQRAEAVLATASATVARSRRFQGLAEARLGAGLGLSIDRTRAEVAVLRDELAEREARTAVVTARQDLAAALLLSADQVTLPAPAPLLAVSDLPSPAQAEALAQALQTPTVDAAQAAVEAARRQRQATGAQALPSLDGWAQAGAYSSANGDGPFVSGGLQATVPLFLGGRVRAERSGAQADETAAQAGLDAARADVAATLRSLQAELSDRAAALPIAQAAEALAGDEVRQAEERYAAGVGSSYEVADAVSRAAQAERARVDTVWAYNRAVVSWWLVTGAW